MFDFHPLLVDESGPDVVRLCDGRLVWTQNALRAVVVHVQRAKNQDHSRERGVGGDRLEPVVVQVEQQHLRLRRFQYQIAELLDFQTGLERQLQLTALDHDVREVQQVHLHI